MSAELRLVTQPLSPVSADPDRMTRRRFLVGMSAVGLSLGAVGALEACGQAAPKSQSSGGPPVTIRFGHHHVPNGQVDTYAQKFASLVSKKTNGQATVQIFPNAQLGAEGDAVKGVAQGTLQMTIGSSPFLADYTKEMGTEQLPFLFDSWDQAIHAFEGSLGAELNKRAEQASGSKGLAWLTIGWRHMYFRDRDVSDINGIKGLKMRAPQIDFYVKMFELLGARPTTITFSEIYTALQSGVVVGLENPLQVVIDNKFYEVCKQVTLTQHMFSSITHWVNKQFFGTLPSNVQRAITESAKEAVHTMNQQYRKDEEDATGKLKSLGLAFHDIKDRPAWKNAMQPLLQDWVKQRPGAQSLIDIISKTK
jgi:tripartite ATP-independent transporter DctP family solute receptor